MGGRGIDFVIIIRSLDSIALQINIRRVDTIFISLILLFFSLQWSKLTQTNETKNKNKGANQIVRN